MSRFKHYEAPSVIAERKRAKEHDAEQREQAAEAKARADALMAKYREMDLAMRRRDAEARALAEEARALYERNERLAQLRADRMEHDQAIESRAREILQQREALADPQLASAYVTDDAVPRLEGDAPRMGRMGSSAPNAPLVASAIEDVATLYVSKLGAARIVRLPSDPQGSGRILDEQLDRIYDAHALEKLLAAGEWEPVPGEAA